MYLTHVQDLRIHECLIVALVVWIKWTMHCKPIKAVTDIDVLSYLICGFPLSRVGLACFPEIVEFHSPSGNSPTGCHTRPFASPAMRPTQACPQVTQPLSALWFWFIRNTNRPRTCLSASSCHCLKACVK